MGLWWPGLDSASIGRVRDWTDWVVNETNGFTEVRVQMWEAMTAAVVVIASCGGAYAAEPPASQTDSAQRAVPAAPMLGDAPKLTLEPQPADTVAQPGHFVHNRDSDPRRPPVIMLIDGRYELTTRADVGGDPGSVRIQRSAMAGNLIFGPEHDVQVSMPVDWEVSTYSFREADALFPGGVGRVRSFQQIVFTPNIEMKLSEHWGVFGGALLFDAGQFNADNSTTYGGFGGVIYRPDKTLTLRLGFGARTQLEDEVQALPAFWMEWKLDERTRLTSQGNNIRFEYDFAPAWCVKADLAFEQRAYRLDSDGPGPEAVFRDNSVPLSVRLEFVPHPAARFEAWVGTNLSREMTVDLDKDIRFSRSHASPSIMCGISFEIIFGAP